jgi:hypothetical protein
VGDVNGNESGITIIHRPLRMKLSDLCPTILHR